MRLSGALCIAVCILIASASTGCTKEMPLKSEGTSTELAQNTKGRENSNAEDHEDNYNRGELGDLMHTYFFDYQVNNATLSAVFHGAATKRNESFLIVDVTVCNTTDYDIEMYDTDFQVQWGTEGEEDFRVPITYDTEAGTDLPIITNEQFPSTYTLSAGEERKGYLVYEVPDGYQNFSISYQGYFRNNTYGDTYYVLFTATEE